MKKNEVRKKGTALVKSDGNGVEKSYAAWSRYSLLNWLSTDLYEREGKWRSAA